LGSNGTTLSWVSGGGFTGGTISNQLTISNANVSTSTTTGALVVAGGVGIAGNLVQGPVPVLRTSSVASAISTAPQAIDWFGNLSYRTAKYVISTTDVTNSFYQSTEIILVQDGTTSTISTYGLVSSSGNTRMTFTSNVVSGNVILWATGVSANNTVKVFKTLIPV
jgi:hypothetical protein